LGIKQPGLKAEHSPSSSAKIRNAKSYTFSSPYAFKARGKDNLHNRKEFYLTFRTANG
jgi:hypothetical protein